MNMHSSTIGSSMVFVSAGVIGLDLYSGNNILTLLFLALTIFSFILSLGFLSRFIINYRKCGEILKSPLNKSIIK